MKTGGLGDRTPTPNLQKRGKHWRERKKNPCGKKSVRKNECGAGKSSFGRRKGAGDQKKTRPDDGGGERKVCPGRPKRRSAKRSANPGKLDGIRRKGAPCRNKKGVGKGKAAATRSDKWQEAVAEEEGPAVILYTCVWAKEGGRERAKRIRHGRSPKSP